MPGSQMAPHSRPCEPPEHQLQPPGLPRGVPQLPQGVPPAPLRPCQLGSPTSPMVVSRPWGPRCPSGLTNLHLPPLLLLVSSITACSAARL